jgi:hypothetical protein
VLVATIVVATGAACAGDDDQAGSPAGAEAEPTFTLTAPPAGETVEETTAPAETRPDPAPDQSTWAREVDAACRESQERLDALEPPQDTSIEGFVAEALPLMRQQIEAVVSVDARPGSADAQGAKLLVAEMRAVEAALGRYAEALRADDGAAARAALVEAGTAGAEARRRASALGVTACGGFAGG